MPLRGMEGFVNWRLLGEVTDGERSLAKFSGCLWEEEARCLKKPLWATRGFFRVAFSAVVDWLESMDFK